MRKAIAVLAGLILFVTAALSLRQERHTLESMAARLVKAGLPCRNIERDGRGLFRLDLSESAIADLSALKGLPLSGLDIHKTAVSDLSPLQGMQLVSLTACKSRVASLAPLEGMPLQTLKCSHTQVSNLSPFRGMPLRTLWINETRVADLCPLNGMALVDLRVDGTQVTDLSALEGMPLQTLQFSPQQTERGVETIRRMEKLARVNGMPARRYWKVYERAERGGAFSGLPGGAPVE